MFFESDELDQIESYLSGELEGEALAAFEAELEESPQLKKKVKIHKAVMQGIRDYALLQDGKQARTRQSDSELESEHKDVKKNDAFPRIGMWKPIAIAASVLFFLASSVLFYTLNQEQKIGGSTLDYQRIVDYQLITQKVENLKADSLTTTPTGTLTFSLFHNKIDALQYDFDGETLQLFLDNNTSAAQLEDFQVFVVEETSGEKKYYLQFMQNYYILMASDKEEVRSLPILTNLSIVEILRKL